MKRCTDCGEEFENMAALIKHRRTECRNARSEGAESARQDADEKSFVNIGFAVRETLKARGLDANDPRNWYAELGGMIRAAGTGTSTAAAPFVIPTAFCPSEIGVLGRGQTVGLRIMGRLVDGGVQVDNVEFVR